MDNLFMFDLDGTLIKSFIRDDPQKHGSDMEAEVYDKVELLPRRWDMMHRLALQGGSRFALVSNQAGVAFGYQTVPQVHAKVGKVLAELCFLWRQPFSVHLAFGHPKAAEDGDFYEPASTLARRKPGVGMLFEAARNHYGPSIKWVDIVDRCTFVGDMESDAGAARFFGCRYYDAEEFFGTGGR